MLEKIALLKFTGQDIQFNLFELEEMYVPEFEWWIKRLNRHYEQKSQMLQQQNERNTRSFK